MWLLNVETRRLEPFVNDRAMFHRYAILTHTWDDEEVTFDDIHERRATTMKGYRKIDYACQQALEDGISYVWIDTCCIDKRSSAELSEAINTMWTWYYNAQVCYAFLADVQTTNDEYYPFRVQNRDEKDFSSSRWFTRGWTLQELIAPKKLKFFEASWRSLGAREEMVRSLVRATSIPPAVLKDRDQLWATSIAQRMSWAAKRRTTRIEDQAYSLLGLFDVNMPLMYGEGNKAFRRLQEEIIRSRAWEKIDHSILVWPGKNGDLFASSAADFGDSNHITNWALSSDSIFELSNKGLRIGVFARLGATNSYHIADTTENRVDAETVIVVLNCRRSEGSDCHIALQLRRRPQIWTLGQHIQDRSRDDSITYERLPGYHFLRASDLRQYTATTVTIARTPFVWPEMTIERMSISMSSTTWIAGVDATSLGSAFSSTSSTKLTWKNDSAIVGLRHLRQQIFYCNLLVGRRGQTRAWPDTSLTVLVDFETTPAKLYVRSSQEWPVRRTELLAFSHERMTGEETRIIVQGDHHVLKLVTRYVSDGVVVHWDLEVGRPGEEHSARLPPLVCEGVELPQPVDNNVLDSHEKHAATNTNHRANVLEQDERDELEPASAPIVRGPPDTQPLFLGDTRPWTKFRSSVQRLLRPRRRSRMKHEFNPYNAPPIFELPGYCPPCELACEQEYHELPASGQWNRLHLRTASVEQDNTASRDCNGALSAKVARYQTRMRVERAQQQQSPVQELSAQPSRSALHIPNSLFAARSEPRAPFGVPSSTFLRAEFGCDSPHRHAHTPDSGYVSDVGDDSTVTESRSACSDAQAYDVRRLWRLPKEFDEE